jgi:hypothetical protein
MKTTRPAIAAVVAVTAALLFSGCAGGSGDASSSTADAQNCDTLRSEIRDINNGAQNTLAGDLSEGQADAKTYFDGLGDRVDTLEDTWESNKAVTSALDTLSDKLDAAEDFIDTVPTDGTDPDADALATASTDISDAAAAVNDACTAK